MKDTGAVASYRAATRQFHLSTQNSSFQIPSGFLCPRPVLPTGFRLLRLHRDANRLLTSFHVRPFSPCRHLLWPRLTSSHASQRLTTSVAQGTREDLPGYDTPTFTLMPVGSTSQRSVQGPGFDDNGRLTPLRRLISASCSSGQRFAFGFLQIRSYPRHPCRSATPSPCRASRGLPPPSECALPGAPTKKPGACAPGFPVSTVREFKLPECWKLVCPWGLARLQRRPSGLPSAT